ncbi:S1C family serine protease [Actinophytocola oryzae]|uniref:Putative serine protease PepD n=1 Tax=Actinophytocola oryzae TaxID=502181 RepID=A0A4R7VYQ8_9PSEU|nr:trypsin-like peptidase domain-containing protein [Actinophytocola oryzae]TDV55296.1 putative serine protease PepD [Actinophytocola oryzae]
MTQNVQQAPPPWTYPGNPYPPPPVPPGPQMFPGSPQQRPPRRFRRGTVAAIAAAALVAGGLGGTIGAFVGSDGASQPAATAATTTSASPSTGTEGTDVSAIVAKVMASVVQVNVELANGEAIGSGVVISSDGRILTNNHVVSGADKVTVTLSDGRTVDATVAGTDPSSDLAVIQVQGVSGLTAATFADSSTVKVGDEVIAIGSPGGLQGTVTTGIVSALDRKVTVSSDDEQQQQQEQGFPFGDESQNGSGDSSGSGTTTYQALQTDAAINQGNSGGPLFNTSGQVVGINSAMYSPVTGPDGSAGSVGIGFAIPSNQAQQVIDKL